MAEPIIIVKENPGTLVIEVLDKDRNPVPGSPFRCPGIAFNEDTEITVDGTRGSGDKYKPKKNTPNGTAITFSLKNAAGA